MTPAEYKKLSKPSKYHSSKTYVDGIKFDSKREAERYGELKLLEKSGAITDLKLQVRFELYPKHVCEGAIVPASHYIADFVYTDTRTGKQIVEDAKGKRTDVYKRKKKQMRQRYGIEIQEV